MTPDEVRDALARFRPEYVTDWTEWVATHKSDRPATLGLILRRWQATRPHPMRRTRSEGRHAAPYLEDLLASAAGPVEALRPLGLSWINLRSAEQTRALRDLWAVFAGLTVTGSASCVGISKAVMLVTYGQIGPALDSQVRGRLRIRPPLDSDQWIDVLEEVGADIRAFEMLHGTLRRVAPPKYASLADGRLYDMIFGPGAT
jgi:hypothetical protein